MVALKRSIAINKKLSEEYTKLKNLKNRNAVMEKKNKKLKKQIQTSKNALNAISERRRMQVNEMKRNKNVNAWLKQQETRFKKK